MARKTKEEAERTRNTLLDAAARLFVRHGVARTTLNDIARAAGVTRGAVYWHFDNKDAVITALWERDGGELNQHFVEALDGLDPNAPRKALHQALQRLLRRVVEDDKLSQAIRITMHRIEFTDEATDLQRYLHQRRDHFYATLLRAMKRLAGAGALRDELSAEVATSALWSYLHGLVHAHLEPGSPTVDLAHHGETLLGLLLDGLLKP